MKNGNAYKPVSAIYDDYITGEKFPFNIITKIIWGFKDTDYAQGLLEKIPNDFSGKLLDLPAGTGVLTGEKYTRLESAHIVCMDYSNEMLSIAQKRFFGSNLKNVSCIQGDAGAIPFHDETFNMVLSMNGFHAFPNKEKALAEIYRVLKKGGIFTGCFYIKGETRRTDWFVKHLFARNGTFTPPFYTKTEIIEKLEKNYAGLELWNTGSIACFTCKKPARGIIHD
jgi:ubiquinone/menaquinone biosynthesis C-methylase UbiE